MTFKVQNLYKCLPVLFKKRNTMIKTAILWVTLIFLSKPLFADTTEVIIIGTVHYETDNFTPDSLYNIFTKITPNVILLESDASYLTEDFKLRPGYEDIANETKAVTKYLMNSNPLLRPYDLENRDQFLFSTNRRRTERAFFDDLSDLYDEGKLTPDAIQLTDDLITNMSDAQSMTLSTPFNINRDENREIIEKINYYDFEAVSKIIEMTPALSSYGNYWKEVNDFWLMRNDAMIENIKNYVKDFSGSRIVVLCGFAHKPYLLEGLSSLSKNGDIVIKNYWEN